MSNSMAIATVTATLIREIIEPGVKTVMSGVNISTGRPESSGTGNTPARVNLYLFQVTPNAAWRNSDLPTRTSEGRMLVQRPRVAIDLHYLLSVYGNDQKLESQRLLGSIVQAMHSRPVLTRDMIRNTIGSTDYRYLAGSNLADQVELVKFTPLALSLEELAKIWSVFFQTQHALSVAYQGTVVLIESEETPRSTLPVKERLIYAQPFRHPQIERVYPETGVERFIHASDTLVIEGNQLRGQITQVRVAGGGPLSPGTVSDTRITFPLTNLPAGTARAGVQGVQVVQPIKIGKPAVPHTGFESNVAAFVLHPKIVSVTAPTPREVSVKTDVLIEPDQRVLLFLNESSGADPTAYSFQVASRPPNEGAKDTLKIPISGVKPATYLVRIQVDGAESAIDLDPASRTYGPTVVIR